MKLNRQVPVWFGWYGVSWCSRKVYFIPEDDALVLASPGNEVLEPLGYLAAGLHRLRDGLSLQK